MRAINRTLVVALVALTWASARLVECSREIGVYGPNNLRTNVTVNLNSTVKDIKAKLERHMNIPIERQKLFLNGTELEDSKTVIECKLWRFSVLKLEVDTFGKLIKLNVNCDGEEMGQVEVGIWFTIEKIKSIIFFSLGAYPERFKLGGFSSTSLANNSTLNQHISATDNVSAEALNVYCIRKETNSFQLSIKYLDGQTLRIEAHPHDTIGSIKLKVEFILGVAAEQQELLIDGAERDIQLENDKTLANYEICNYAGLKLRTKPKIKLSVRHIPNINIIIEVEANEPLENIRSILSRELGLPNENQNLTSNGQIMGDGTRLSDYLNATNLYLIPVERTIVENLYIISNRSRLNLHAEYDGTIEELKQWIETEHQIPAAKQRLFLNDLELLNDKNLGDYRIFKNTTMKLIVADDENDDDDLSLNIKFKVKNLLGNEVSFDLSADETIGNLKKLIENSPLKIPIHKQRLFFLGHELDDDNTLRHYEISEDSLIHVAFYNSTPADTS